MRNERVVVITDIHGCYDEMRQLLDKLSFDKGHDRLINLGDTIDRGPKIYEVFEFLRDLKEEMGERCVLIRGNHDKYLEDRHYSWYHWFRTITDYTEISDHGRKVILSHYPVFCYKGQYRKTSKASR